MLDRVADEVLVSMRRDAEENLADPQRDDVFLAKYDWPVQVNSRDLLMVLDELESLRRKVETTGR